MILNWTTSLELLVLQLLLECSWMVLYVIGMFLLSHGCSCMLLECPCMLLYVLGMFLYVIGMFMDVLVCSWMSGVVKPKR